MKLENLLRWTPWDMWRYLSRNVDQLELVPKVPTKKMIEAACGKDCSEEDARLLTLEWTEMVRVSSAFVEEEPKRTLRVGYIRHHWLRRLLMLILAPLMLAWNVFIIWIPNIYIALFSPLLQAYRLYQNIRSLWHQPRTKPSGEK